MAKTYYCIGNAHLDPVWMWQWTEGYAETKATFRSALDRMNEYEDFIFVCSSASIYEWLEESVPAMFEEIVARVREGRWVPVGGWWVQPDCNQPSGESFARHGVISQNYFNDKFGVTAKVGYNVDSFGHNRNIPQILKKSGMNYYVYMRPGEHEMHMDTNVFKWQAQDGSEVIAYRLAEAYCYNVDGQDSIDRAIADGDRRHDDSIADRMFFYGVGNHGGGPTIRNIETIHEKNTLSDDEFVLANPLDFFKKVEQTYNLKTHADDLQHHASGCYSAVSLIKTLNRRCESMLYSAEAFSSLSSWMSGASYPADKLREAWKNTLFNQFHDSLGGCSIKPAYDDAAMLGYEAMSAAKKAENRALQTISWMVDTSAVNRPVAVVVFNPHSWDASEYIQVNKRFDGVVDADGNAIPVQYVASPSQFCTHRPDTLFNVKVPALGYSVYYAAEKSEAAETGVSCHDNVLENKFLKVTFEPYTGYIKSIIDKESGAELLSGRGAVPTVIDEFDHDTWSHARNYFTKTMAYFADAELKVIETGTQRAAMKVTSRYNSSTLTQYFYLGADSKTLSVKANIDWHEKHKMLKLAYPANVSAPKAFYEIPFGYIERPCDGEEECGHEWICVSGENGGAALINNNKYSFNIDGSCMNLTVVRSPLYGDHGAPRNDEGEFTDQGAHDFSYEFVPFVGKPDFAAITKQARQFNIPTTHIVENNHKGTLPLTSTGISVSAANVIVSAIKEAEDGCGFIVRAYELSGIATAADMKIHAIGAEIKASFTPHEVKTFRISDGAITETLMTELEA